MNYFAYFSEIEAAFVRRRARNLLLSPLDWALIEGWKERGVPLFVVIRAIDAVFDAAAERDKHTPRKRPIKSLLYCRDEVENQFAAWLEAQVGVQAKSNEQIEAQSFAATAENARATSANQQSNSAAQQPNAAQTVSQNRPNAQTAKTQTDSTFSQTQILQHIARLRSHFAGENNVFNGSWARLSERVTIRLNQAEAEFLRDGGDAEKLETALDELDQKIDEILNKIFDQTRFAEIERHTGAQLRAFKRQMPPEAFEQTHRALLIKNLREAADLPRFSLFYL